MGQDFRRGVLVGLARESFGGTRTADGTKVLHIGQAHDVAASLCLVHFEPLDVLHDLAKANQEVDLRLGIGLAFQDVERSLDVLFALHYVFAVHNSALSGCTLEQALRAVCLPNP